TADFPEATPPSMVMITAGAAWLGGAPKLRRRRAHAIRRLSTGPASGDRSRHAAATERGTRRRATCAAPAGACLLRGRSGAPSWDLAAREAPPPAQVW